MRELMIIFREKFESGFWGEIQISFKNGKIVAVETRQKTKLIGGCDE